MKKIIILIFLFSATLNALCQQKITFNIDGKKDSALVYLPNEYKTSKLYPLLIYSVGVNDTTDLFVPFFLRDKRFIRAIPFSGDTFFSSKSRNGFRNFLIKNFPVDTLNIIVLQQ